MCTRGDPLVGRTVCTRGDTLIGRRTVCTRGDPLVGRTVCTEVTLWLGGGQCALEVTLWLGGGSKRERRMCVTLTLHGKPSMGKRNILVW